jgi:hypothetical protein
VLRTLAHYWRINLAVALGAAVATAVLTGALLVGDSVRGSLRELTLDRLGRIDLALVGERFFREELAADLRAQGLPAAAPAILLEGAATHGESGARASGVAIVGVEAAFVRLFGGQAELDLDRAAEQMFPPVVLNETLARELGAAPGAAIVLHLPRPGHAPRETLMGETDPEDVLGRLRLTVESVIPDRGLGRFGLLAQQRQPRNAFVELRQLQRSLDLAGRVNAVVATGADAERADPILASALRLADLGLRLERRDGFLELTSDEFVLRPEVDRAIDPLLDELGAPVLRSQSYLANRIVAGERLTPYVLVAALGPLPDEPWTKLVLADGSSARLPADDGILIDTWLAEDLQVAQGDTVEMRYFVVGPREELREESQSFRVAGVVAMSGLAADICISSFLE